MHCGQTARDFQRPISQWRCHITLEDVHFLAPPTNRSAEMLSNSFACVHDRAGLEDSFKNHTHRVGKTRRGVGHLWEQAPNAAVPAPLTRDTPRLARPNRTTT